MFSFPALLSAQSIPLLSQSALDPYGLKRVWFHQLKLHNASGKVQNIFLEGGQLFLTTSDAVLHVLDSETGQWHWSRTIGKREMPLTEPAVNSRVVAVHNNVSVFLFNRRTGKQLLEIPLPESAAAACEMSEHYLYVPMVNQTFLVYALKESLTPQPLEESGRVKPVEPDYDPELKKILQQFEDAKRMLRSPEPEDADDETFVLDSTHRIPITSASFGTIRTKPLLLSQFYTWVLDEEKRPTHEVDALTHREFIAWATEQGFLYTAGINQLSENSMPTLYRVDSAGQMFYIDQSRTIQTDRPGNRALPARPAQSQLYPVNELDTAKILVPDLIVTGGQSSYVFAIDARTGMVHWRYPTQGPISEPVAVVGRDVFVPTANGVLHAFDLISGEERWVTKNVKRFVASSQKRLYVMDQRNRLVCLDRASGASVFVYDIRRFDHCLYNVETDQIFLVTNNGLVQCIRERQCSDDTGSDVSLRHRISSAEFVDAVRGGDLPELWWLEEREPDMQSETESESP